MWQRWLICLSMFSWFIISMNHLACKISEDSKKSQLYFLRHKFMYSDRLLRFHPVNNPDPEYNQLPIVWLRKVKSVWLIVWSRDRNNESGSKIVAHFHRSNLLNRCSSSWSPLKCLQFGSVRTQISRHPPKAVVIPSSRDIGGFFLTVAILWPFSAVAFYDEIQLSACVSGELAGHRDLVSGFSFCQHAGQSHVCVSSSNDGSIRFWDSDNKVLIKEHAAHQVSVGCLVSLRQGNRNNVFLQHVGAPCRLQSVLHQQQRMSRRQFSHFWRWSSLSLPVRFFIRDAAGRCCLRCHAHFREKVNRAARHTNDTDSCSRLQTGSHSSTAIQGLPRGGFRNSCQGQGGLCLFTFHYLLQMMPSGYNFSVVWSEI